MPIYWGAPDVAALLNPEAFVHCSEAAAPNALPAAALRLVRAKVRDAKGEKHATELRELLRPAFVRPLQHEYIFGRRRLFCCSPTYCRPWECTAVYSFEREKKCDRVDTQIDVAPVRFLNLALSRAGLRPALIESWRWTQTLCCISAC